VTTIERILRMYQEILETTLSNPKFQIGDGLERTDMGRQPDAATADPALANEPVAPAEQKAVAPHAESARAEAKPNAERVLPRDALELQIAGIWETAMGRKNLSIRDNFFDLGGRSLAAMRIVCQVNRIYSVNFGLATLFSGNTIERLADLVRKRLSDNTSSSIVAMQPRGSAAPLFIIHGAGGNIIRFYQLAMMIGTDHPIYGIQAQSLLSGQPALLRMEDQAAFYLAEVQKIQPKGPYFFLGYSFGGTTALEMAHQLRKQGERVELLGMLDSRQRDYMTLMLSKDSVRTRLDRRFARFLGNLAPLSFGEKVAYLRGKLFTRLLRRCYSIALSMGFRTVPSFLKSTEDISWLAAINYKPAPWPGQLTLFRASVQPDPRLPKDLGWTPLAEGGVEVLELPGDHDLVFREDNTRVLAEKLRARLEQSDATLDRADAPAYSTK